MFFVFSFGLVLLNFELSSESKCLRKIFHLSVNSPLMDVISGSKIIMTQKSSLPLLGVSIGVHHGFSIHMCLAWFDLALGRDLYF